jgi:hypothetical protein
LRCHRNGLTLSIEPSLEKISYAAKMEEAVERTAVINPLMKALAATGQQRF